MWVDQETVVDRGVVTSRNPNDIPAFNAAMIEEFARTEQRQRRMAS
jgi:protease I